MRIFIFLIFLSITLCSLGAELKGSISGSTYADYMEKINLSASQKEKILNIKKEEKQALEPIVLNIHSKEEGLNYLKSLKCGAFEFDCKKKLKEDILKREEEKLELMRQIEIKRRYYNIRYRNVLTRSQDHQIKEMIKKDEHIEKVLKERQKKHKKKH